VNSERKEAIMELKKALSNSFICFDGAMGTMLQREGLKGGELPETYNITHPEVVVKIHKAYAEAGANIITANTFGANELKLKNTGYSVEEIITSAVNLVKTADSRKLAALDIGPTGQLLKPMGTLSFERAYEIFARQVRAGVNAGADLILIETISDLYEAKAAVLAAKENSDLPVFCTVTFQEDGRTLTGADPLTVVNVLQGLGVDALGVNCSLGAKELIPIVKNILRFSQVPVIVQPNAGIPKIISGEPCYEINLEQFCKYIKDMAELGANIFGGCCGTTPKFVKSICDTLAQLRPIERCVEKLTAVSSYSKTVVLGEDITIIGERINPTGKKKFKEALKNNDLDYILSEAILQKEAGAKVLDVNVGLPEIDEKGMMIQAVQEIQSIMELPLQIDSVRPEVIEAAVRIYNGKPIINSVNGKKSSMNKIFPIAKKYGACVIGLTLDERGIPKTAEDRFKIAQKIIETAKTYGIEKEDIIIDCLTLTASAQQSDVMEAVKAVRLVKNKLRVRTTLGISNVSFGMPARDILNSTFLTMALANGLDAPIMNPLSEETMRAIKAFRVLANLDKEGMDFIENCESAEKRNETKKTSSDLKDLVMQGRKEEAALKAKELLEEYKPIEVVDLFLIPALEIVGIKFEMGEIFLPQLIQSAETVKSAFEIIKTHLANSGEEKVSKGKILLATVKGDVHDIGKNIVKILLENYGFDVIDMGKDVEEEAIIEKLKAEDIKLVGLSALMTTTVKSMQKAIKTIKDEGLACKIMVGGAVLNPEYAKMVKADFYAKDAREGVKIAQSVFKV
jgi:5-methyltetrahydrofolate--homocysteine methyltransferase